jgi:hypothetical protein
MGLKYLDNVILGLSSNTGNGRQSGDALVKRE